MPMTGDLVNRARFFAGGLVERGNSASAVELGPMVKGNKYVLSTDVLAYFYQGAAGMTAVTTSTGMPLRAGESVTISCEHATEDVAISIIPASGTAVTYLWRVD